MRLCAERNPCWYAALSVWRTSVRTDCCARHRARDRAVRLERGDVERRVAVARERAEDLRDQRRAVQAVALRARRDEQVRQVGAADHRQRVRRRRAPAEIRRRQLGAVEVAVDLIDRALQQPHDAGEARRRDRHGRDEVARADERVAARPAAPRTCRTRARGSGCGCSWSASHRRCSAGCWRRRRRTRAETRSADASARRSPRTTRPARR